MEFAAPPQDKFYGTEALMKDNSGNWFSMTQPNPAHQAPAQSSAEASASTQG